MQNWRRLALEPSALRAPDSFADPRSLGSDGRHLAATLFRIAHENEDNDDDRDPEAIYAQVAGRLADLGDLGVTSIDVEPDQKREVLTLFLHERTGMRLPARALSEGTLRFLALCVLLEDPSVHGVICMEEPENGIHPANLKAMLDLVRDLAVDPNYPLGDDNPFRQVIVNTHSPGVVQLCDPDDLLFAENRQQVAPDGTVGQRTLAAAAGWNLASGIHGEPSDQGRHAGLPGSASRKAVQPSGGARRLMVRVFTGLFIAEEAPTGRSPRWWRTCSASVA